VVLALTSAHDDARRAGACWMLTGQPWCLNLFKTLINKKKYAFHMFFQEKHAVVIQTTFCER